MKIYILKNEYAPDGYYIHGVYSSEEKAKDALKGLKSGDSLYDFSEDFLDSMTIISYEVY